MAYPLLRQNLISPACSQDTCTGRILHRIRPARRQHGTRRAAWGRSCALVIALPLVRALPIREVASSVALLVHGGEGGKSKRRNHRHEWSKRGARNGEYDPLLFTGEQARETDIADDLKCRWGHGSSFRDKVYLHFKDARRLCSVRVNQFKADQPLGLPRAEGQEGLRQSWRRIVYVVKNATTHDLRRAEMAVPGHDERVCHTTNGGCAAH